MIDLSSLLEVAEADVISLQNNDIIRSKPLNMSNSTIGLENPQKYPLGFSNINYNTNNDMFSVKSSKSDSIWKINTPGSLLDSPLTPMSLGYSKFGLPSPFNNNNNIELNTIENVQAPYFQNNFNSQYLFSRVLLATCNDLKKLTHLIQVYIDPLNIIGTRQIMIGETQCLVIGWFDLRNISNNVNNLTFIANNEGLNDLDFSYINDNLTFNHVINTHNFRFLEDCYDTIYITIDNQLPNFNIYQFQNDLYFQLSKNGAINTMEQIKQDTICFKVRFYDIRVTFELQKMTYIKVGSLRAKVYSTLVDLYGSCLKQESSEKLLSNNSKSSPQQCGLPALNESEWKKYMQLKHRRLASLPFSMSGIPQENKIDISKLTSNEERRVTVMIRNVPNKVTHNELKEYIDETSWGDYEFLCMFSGESHIFAEIFTNNKHRFKN